jgi:hypothetical protein
MRTLSVRILTLLVAVAVLLSSGVGGRTQYFCRMMDRVMSECCCKGKQQRADQHKAGIEAADCCKRIAPSTHAAVAATRDSVASIPQAQVVATLSTFDWTLPAAQQSITLPVLARGPPDTGPPLFIAHCALLI